MSFIVINYFKNIIINVLSNITQEPFDNHHKQFPTKSIHLSEAVFMMKNNKNTRTRCYTSIYPKTCNSLRHKLRDLRVLQNKGFKTLDDSDWSSSPQRLFDSVGGTSACKGGRC